MINIKYCKKCGRAYDFEECPYCRKEKIKEEKRKDVISNQR